MNLFNWRIICLVCTFCSGVLFTINIVGLFLEIEPQYFAPQDLRFQHNEPLSFENTLKKLNKSDAENEQDFAIRIAETIAKRLAHIKWDNVSDNQKYHQLVPIWENYILYFMGKVIKLDEYQRYHYADYKRSLARGIGICGDASMIASQVLNKHGITNQIISFPRHVVVEVKTAESSFIIDPDFGVSLENTNADNLKNSSALINRTYIEAGYTDEDIKDLPEIYNAPYQRWDGVKRFITKKYYFEYVAYYLKWGIPLLLLLLSRLICRKFIQKN